MTELLYQKDSYLQTFDALILGVDIENHAVLLDRTAFYPGGGGQPADNGFLTFGDQTMPIVKFRKVQEEVWHTLSPEAILPTEGAKVKGEVEWTRRYQLMRTHSALHVLCGTIFRDFGAQVTGGDMDPLKGRMDFEFESMTADLVKVIEEAVNREAGKDHSIRVAILPRDEAFKIPDLIRTKINLLPPGIPEVRTVEIVGLDLQADGGTHVHSTREIGTIHVVDYKSKGRINKRLYIEMDPS